MPGEDRLVLFARRHAKRRHLVLVVSAAIVCGLVLGSSALAKPETVRVGNLVLTDDGGLSPSKLPRHRQAPVAAKLRARIGTSDGSHPPAVESVVADFDKTIRVNARGLPACRRSQLTARSSVDARRACRGAVVGSGSGEVAVAFPEQRPFTARGPIVLFNGGVRGKTTLLLIHAYVSVPAPSAVVARVELSRVNRGRYGLHTVARIPPIAGGAGSVTAFRLTIDRKFTHRGKRRSYLTASCPTGRYYAKGRVRFADGTALQITHALPCTPKD